MRYLLPNRLTPQAHTIMAGLTKNIPRPTNRFTLISTLIFTLDFQQIQLQPILRRRVYYSSKIVASIISCEAELGHNSEICGGHIAQDPAGFTTSVSCEVDTTKSEYLDFYPFRMFIINWIPTGVPI